MDGDRIYIKTTSKEKTSLKDLKSENKRSRKSPSKPWGRAERCLIFVLILVTAGISAYLWYKSQNPNLLERIKGFFKFNPPTFVGGIREETIIIESGDD
jgi:hypothetical protein